MISEKTVGNDVSKENHQRAARRDKPHFRQNNPKTQKSRGWQCEKGAHPRSGHRYASATARQHGADKHRRSAPYSQFQGQHLRHNPLLHVSAGHFYGQQLP